MKTLALFPSQIVHVSLIDNKKALNELVNEAFQFERSDLKGKKWCQKNYPNGYTSYASLPAISEISSSFLKIKKMIDQQVNLFCRQLDMDIPLNSLTLSSFWINIMRENCIHSSHLHPLSVVSGTFYLQTPLHSSALKFEDPRLAMHMASPPRKSKARKMNQRFISLQPKAGDLILFESFMKHEVPLSHSKEPRVSLSFNYDWI